MALIWNGVDITGRVDITGCIHRDYSHGRCDCLELTMDRAAEWYAWKPEPDDEIIYTDGYYSTGRLYLNSVAPEGDQFRVFATATRQAAAQRAWEVFAGETFGSIIRKCAAECGMDGKIFGMNEALPYPFVVRQNTGCAAFLDHIGQWEGAAIKALDGAFRAVGIEYAQALEPVMEIDIISRTPGTRYARRQRRRLSALKVVSPYAEATARDRTAERAGMETVAYLPAMDGGMARRWAHGLLLMRNREAETLELTQGINLAMTALIRVDVTGSTPMAGKWIIDHVEHDFINRQSKASLCRVIDTIE